MQSAVFQKPGDLAVRCRLTVLSHADSDLLFAYRRNIAKELQYDERDKPMVRRALKKKKWVRALWE